MERYTKRLNDGQAVMDCQGCPESWMSVPGSGCTALYCRDRLKDRVAAYEDTGLEPQEIERIVDTYGRGHTLRTESAERLEIIREIPTDRLRELADVVKDIPHICKYCIGCEVEPADGHGCDGEYDGFVFSVRRLRELVDADKESRVVVLPKDGMVYYIEEAGGEKWIANKPIQQITVKCGWGIASVEFSLFDTGKYFCREAAEAALKGKKDG